MKDSKSFKGNPNARIAYMKVAFGEDILNTEVELLVCQSLIEPGRRFLVYFQSEHVLIHRLHEAYYNLMMNVLAEICEAAGLKKTTDRTPLSSKDLKTLVLESKEERNERRLRGNISSIFVRRALLVDEKEVLLDRELLTGLENAFEKNRTPKTLQSEMTQHAKSMKFKFLVALAKSYQHFLPLDNLALKDAAFLCPVKAVEDEDAEKTFVDIAHRLPNFNIALDTNDLQREMRRLQRAGGQEFFDREDLQLYRESLKPSSLSLSDIVAPAIDKVWLPIIVNKEQFPALGKVL